VPFVQLPCTGVVSEFRISRPELEYWLKGKTSLSEYLAQNTIDAAEQYAAGTPWTRVLWDVTAVAWLLNDNNRFMKARIQPIALPTYDHYYTTMPNAHPMCYVYHINRDALMTDLIQKLTQ
jgi:hypothetical protein